MKESGRPQIWRPATSPSRLASAIALASSAEGGNEEARLSPPRGGTGNGGTRSRPKLIKIPSARGSTVDRAQRENDKECGGETRVKWMIIE